MYNIYPKTPICGLTGSIAVGKSTVTKFLRKAGCPVIDADIIAREVVVPGSCGLEKIISTFGKEFLLPDGNLNRSKLGQLVFSNQEKLDQLNLIMQPLIETEAEKQLVAMKSLHEICFYDAALIIENGNLEKYRPLIVVKADPDTQLLRLMARNSLTQDAARNIISKQLSSEAKAKYADFVIHTNGTLEELELNTEATLQEVKAFVKGYKAGRELNIK